MDKKSRVKIKTPMSVLKGEIEYLELEVKKAQLEKELKDLQSPQKLLGDATGNSFVQVPYYPNHNIINPYPNNIPLNAYKADCSICSNY